MHSPYDFLTALAKELAEKRHVHVYAGYRPGGALLVRWSRHKERILFRPSDSSRLVGRQKILDAMSRLGMFKGQRIGTWVFVARGFRPNAVRVLEEHNVALVEIEDITASATIVGSRNLPAELLPLIVEAVERHGFKVSYDSEAIVRPTGSGSHKGKAETMPRVPRHPTAFLSYSWDSDEHRHWVLKLAADLIRNGVDVLIDEWDLADHGNDLHQFMESGIRDSDFVIMVCTTNYAERTDRRQGGVGAESTIITGEFYEPQNAGKYIPIVRGSAANVSTCLPSFLKSKFTVKFNDDDAYPQGLENLLRRIAGRPKFRKPKLGDFPDLPSDEL